MADFVDKVRQEINERIAVLRAAVDEVRRLEEAARALDAGSGAVTGAATAAVSRAAAAPAPARRGRPRKRTAGRAKAAGASRGDGAQRGPGRRKGSGARSAQALGFVQGQPGITIPELAAKMGIKQNYLYRVLPALESEGKVEKQGRGWHAKG